MDLVNTPEWWVGRTPGAFTERSQFEQHQRYAEQMRRAYPEALRYCTSLEIIALRELLRKAWTAPDLHTKAKAWFIFLARRFHSEVMRRFEASREDAGKSLVREWLAKKAQLDIILTEPVIPEKVRTALSLLSSEEQVVAAFKDGPPRPSFFENCASYLQKRLNRLRICKRKKSCTQRPYFIAEKAKQKYCSDICFRDSRKASKRKSWHKHKDSWGKKKR